MSIYLDISAAVHRRAGLGRYAESLARALIQQQPGRFGFFYNREHGIEPLAGLEQVPTRTVGLGYKPWRMLVWLGQLAGLGFDRLLPGAELFQATEHLLLPLREVPTVLTVHDLIFRYHPAHHKPLNRWYLNLTMPLYCRRASHIIAISEQTRRDLLAAYGLPPAKITVIYEAADPRFRPQSAESVAAVRARYGLPNRYLLFVGTIEPRKNLTTLLEALNRIRDREPRIKLVIVGRKGWLYEGFFRRLRELSLEGEVIFTGFVPDEDLPAFYTAAALFVFPSLYEGFGLPPLEAMACGVPVVCSNTSSLPEIVGDAALTFDPLDAEEMAATIEEALRHEVLREEMREKGLRQAAKFSWEKTARETRRVYREVAG
jgi:glycosyltransferase involved in cell wall biosynthesis